MSDIKLFRLQAGRAVELQGDASDLEKPRGFSIIGRSEAAEFLADKPVSIMPGIGAAAQARLRKAGVTLVRHLRELPPKLLFETLGRDAARYVRMASGEDTRRVVSRRSHRLKSLPILALSVHSACNCRCVMCDIWKANADKREISLPELDRHAQVLHTSHDDDGDVMARFGDEVDRAHVR